MIGQLFVICSLVLRFLPTAADALTNEGLIFGPWLQRTFPPPTTHPTPPCYNESTCVHAQCEIPYYKPPPVGRILAAAGWHYDEYVASESQTLIAYFNVTGISDALFCNNTMAIRYAELVNDDDFHYVDRGCQLYQNLSFTRWGLTFVPNSNTTVTATHWLLTPFPNTGKLTYSGDPLLLLKHPGSAKYYFRSAFATYLGPDPTASAMLSPILINFDAAENNAPDGYFEHKAVKHRDLEQMIYDQWLVPMNLTEVIPCEHS